MKVAIVTGSGGLIGSEAVKFFCATCERVFFGAEASTRWNYQDLARQFRNYEHIALDIRDADSVNKVFCRIRI